MYLEQRFFSFAAGTKTSLIVFLSLAAGCGGTGSGGEPETTGAKTATIANQLPSDEDILSMAYDAEYHVPDDFFVDERALITTQSYTVHHVLDESTSFELCTDDFQEAQDWESDDNASRAIDGYYVGSYENARYFEFARELDYNGDIGNIGDITSPGFARVFKCSHTNRDGVDRSLPDGYSGFIDATTLADAGLRDFAEYLWQFRFFNVSRKAVLDSVARSSTEHSLLLVFVVSQGAGACDRVEVVDWRFTADPENGRINRKFELVQVFEASNANGVPKFCG